MFIHTNNAEIIQPKTKPHNVRHIALTFTQ